MNCIFWLFSSYILFQAKEEHPRDMPLTDDMEPGPVSIVLWLNDHNFTPFVNLIIKLINQVDEQEVNESDLEEELFRDDPQSDEPLYFEDHVNEEVRSACIFNWFT